MIKAIKPNVQDKTVRKEIYRPIIIALENADWDTQDECLDEDEAYDELIKDMHPGWFDDDEDDAE